MKILFLSQYFLPEIEPSAAKIYDLSRKLVKRGHRVTVITGFPNYPTGVIPPEYKNKLLQEEEVAGIKVLRTFLLPSPNKGFLRRTVSGVSFMFSALLRSLFVERHEVVVTSSPPLETGLAGYLVSRLKRIPFIFEVRDVWPQAAIVLGILKNPFLIRMALFVERFIYRRAYHVVAVTKGVRRHLLDSGVGKRKVTLIRNGVDTEIFRPLDINNRLKEQLGLKGKFVCIYTGTHGLQANLMSVLKAADLLKKNGDIAFLFIGDGAEKRLLCQFKQVHSLSNVIFLDPQPRRTMPKFLSIADLGIVHTRKDAFFEGYLPVKIFEYMACSCPVVLGNNGEARELIEEAHAGVCTEPENPNLLAQAILKLRRDGHLRKRLGINGRKYVTEFLSREVLIEEYERMLTKFVQN